MDANDLVRGIHDRMPVVLRREHRAPWLDPHNRDADGLLAVLKPADPAPSLDDAFRLQAGEQSPQ